MFFKSSDSKPEYKEVATNEEAQLPPRRPNSSTLHYCIIIFLLVGWIATVAYYSQPSSNGPLHVYSFTPIPKEVFKPVKKIFQPDERYIGDTPEVNQNWDALVAGELSSILHTVYAIFNDDQDTTRFGSRSRQNGASHKAS